MVSEQGLAYHVYGGNRESVKESIAFTGIDYI